MSQYHLREALNNCIDRLAQGEGIEDCIQDYPDLADELRSLLEIGQASRLNHADAIELNQMRGRLDTQIETVIAETEFNSSSSFRLPPGLMVLVASLTLMVFGFFIFLPGQNNPAGVQVIETVTAIVPSETARGIPDNSLELTKTAGCPLPDDWIYYRVKPEETLSSIAANFTISIEALLEANCLDNSASILEGQVLYVPSSSDDDDDSDDD